MFGKKKPREKTQAELERDSRQLRRLEVFVDVVFALVFLRIFLLFPKPGEGGLTGLSSFRELLAAGSGRFEMILVGVLLILIYWSQNVKVFGNLSRTDGRHAAMSFLQIFMLLVYLYLVRMEIEFKGERLPLLMQSISLALVGFISVAAWSYAIKDRRLVTESITDAEAKHVRLDIMAEPITAVFTIPFAWLGTGPWTIAWLSGIIVTRILKHWRPAEKA
jgi:uncharacterized membrane protein